MSERNDGKLIKEYIVDKTDGTLKRVEIYELVFCDNYNFVIRKNKSDYSLLFVMNIDEGQFYIKNEKTKKLIVGDDLTIGKIQSFFREWKDTGIKIRNVWMRTSSPCFMHIYLPVIVKSKLCQALIKRGFNSFDFLMSGTEAPQVMRKNNVLFHTYNSRILEVINTAYPRFEMDENMIEDFVENIHLFQHIIRKDKTELVLRNLLTYVRDAHLLRVLCRDYGQYILGWANVFDLSFLSYIKTEDQLHYYMRSTLQNTYDTQLLQSEKPENMGESWEGNLLMLKDIPDIENEEFIKELENMEPSNTYKDLTLYINTKKNWWVYYSYAIYENSTPIISMDDNLGYGSYSYLYKYNTVDDDMLHMICMVVKMWDAKRTRYSRKKPAPNLDVWYGLDR